MHQEDVSQDIRLIILSSAAIFIALAVFIIFFVWMFTRRKNKMLRDKILLEDQLRQTQLEIHEQTLRTISQEIHDNVGQVLSLAKLHLSSLDLSEGSQKENKIIQATSLVGKAINDLRDLSRSMNGDKIADLGLKDAIDNELDIIRNTGLFQTKLMITGEPYKLLPQQEIVCFRIVQESLNNAVKYSKANNIYAEINYQSTLFILKISDDGKGFDTANIDHRKSGIGFKNMKTRAALINARFFLSSKENAGTRITIELDTNPNT